MGVLLHLKTSQEKKAKVKLNFEEEAKKAIAIFKKEALETHYSENLIIYLNLRDKKRLNYLRRIAKKRGQLQNFFDQLRIKYTNFICSSLTKNKTKHK